jgi:hypothetical protein
VVEALALVTWWGLGRLVAPLRRLGRGSRRGGGGGEAAGPGWNGSSGSSGSSGSDTGEPDQVTVR